MGDDERTRLGGPVGQPGAGAQPPSPQGAAPGSGQRGRRQDGPGGQSRPGGQPPAGYGTPQGSPSRLDGDMERLRAPTPDRPGMPPQPSGGYGPPPAPPQYGQPQPQQQPPQAGGGGDPRPGFGPPPSNIPGGYGSPSGGPPAAFGGPPPGTAGGRPPVPGAYGAPPPGGSGPYGSTPGYGPPPGGVPPQFVPGGGYGAPQQQGQQYGVPGPGYGGNISYAGGPPMQTTATPTVRGAGIALAPDLSQLRLGDIVALAGSVLYFLAKFLPFFVISITGVQPLANTYNGWNGSRDLLNILEILAVVAVIGAFAVGPLLNLVPGLRSSIGLIYSGCGAVLLLLTLISFLDVRNEFQQAQFLAGGPGAGFFLGLLLALAVGLAGLVKMGILPGDGAVSLASAPARAADLPPGGQPFSSGHYAPGVQPPVQQQPQYTQGGGYAAPPAAPGNPPGGAPGYAAPPRREVGGPSAPGQIPPPTAGNIPPGGSGGPPGAGGGGPR